MINLTRSEIEDLIDMPSTAKAIEDAYRATSRGEVNLPPVGHITFPGEADCHIKYGHLKGAPTFVIKVATGFPENSAKGLSSGNGIVLVLSAETGQTEAILHDEMVLTDIRTGLGGAIASRTLARSDSQRALVVGTGVQARRQIEAHAALFPSDLSFQVWGRNTKQAQQTAKDMKDIANVSLADDLPETVAKADIIITATGSTLPILKSEWVRPGTHITAVGADAPGKQELEVELIARADLLVADLIAQCLDHGDTSHAFKADLISRSGLQELGAILDNPGAGRQKETDVTIADLTGIAAQDIAIANAVLQTWVSRNSPKLT